VRDLQDRIEALMATLVVAPGGPPEVEYRGFACEGYSIEPAHPLVSSLADAFARRGGAPAALLATTGTTDARIFGLSGVPAVCLGPVAEGAHGAQERVFLPSVVETAQVLGMFVRTWCGLSFT
jgi:acetylornithine deacetylase